MFGIASLEDDIMSDWRDRVNKIEDRLNIIERDVREIKKNAIFALTEPDYPEAITGSEEKDKGIEIHAEEVPSESDSED